MLDNNDCSKTVKGYGESVNTLFKLRGFPIPVDLSDKNNTCTRLIDTMETEEVIAKQQNQITNEKFANLESQHKNHQETQQLQFSLISSA
jgi:hypothetical protein